MAIKGTYKPLPGGDDIRNFMNVTAERGLVVIHDGSGSGDNLDQSASYVAVPTGQAVSSTKPAGILISQVVNYDLTRQHLNQHKDEVQVGSKVTILRHGEVVTNQVTGSPTAGSPAYYNTAGILTPTQPSGGKAIGTFLSSKDSDDYVVVDVNITG